MSESIADIDQNRTEDKETRRHRAGKASAEYSRRSRHGTRDWELQGSGSEKTERVSLGIACLHAVALPGVQYTLEEIAAWAGCSYAAIMLIEKRALRKLRARMLIKRDPVLLELARHFFPDAGKRRAA